MGLDSEGVRFQSIALTLNQEMFQVMKHLYSSAYLPTKLRGDLYNEFNRDSRREYYRQRCVKDPAYDAIHKARNARSAVRTRTERYARSKLNRHRYHEWHRRNARVIRATDPHYNVRNRLSSRLWHAVTSANGKKAAKTEDLIGCSVLELRHKLQADFTEGMTWEKLLRGEIHIDHAVPCRAFDLSDPKQQYQCFHYSNLKPMWAKDNLSKSDRLEDGRSARTMKLNAL